MHTPWGESDYTRRLARGVVEVTTPGHGGIGVTPLAAQRLTPEARALAEQYGGRYWYEEDCKWAIVAYELPELFPDVEPGRALEVVSRWHAEYLLVRGIEPDHEAIATWREMHSGDAWTPEAELVARLRTDRAIQETAFAGGR